MIKSQYVEEVICPVCNKPFFKRKISGKLRAKGMIGNRSIRPFQSRTCCRRCSREWERKKINEKNRIKKEIVILKW
jgi:hypothetical protein